MDTPQNIDEILQSWSYEPGNVCARRLDGEDGREVIQMRIEMGLLQLEIDGRPDGQRPFGAETYFDYLLAESLRDGQDFVLSEEQCEEVDREFVQFYHRRICWLALREFRLAQRDAEHTLELMEFAAVHGPDEQWVMSHEQYRPYVMFHQVKASALAALDEGGAELAIVEIEDGIRRFRELYTKYDAPDGFHDDELVTSLSDLKEMIREHYKVGVSLQEELAQAVAAEQYEHAAAIRDQIRRQNAD